GLNHVRLHDLRHSFASHAASMSETLPMIAKLIGHTSIAMTARYAHLDDTDVLEACERVGAVIARAMEK
ncbi:tyrosine-type recombinase/integrase, partial [Novosphingobium sp.]|uniref:tyrosine-type recombinase/integrase n=1 Tax=Novosphingobium sp. TaxID=1874826 RepID=UPI00260F7EB5